MAGQFDFMSLDDTKFQQFPMPVIENKLFIKINTDILAVTLIHYKKGVQD
jgi:hypothetical protein